MDIPSEDPRFFSFAQQLVARPNGGEMGREMFEDIRQFSFADRTHGWLETESGNLKGTDIHLWRVRSSGHTIELNEDGKATILIPLSGRIDVETRRGEFGASNGKAILFGPNWRRTHVNALDNEYYDALVFFLDPERNGRLREMSAASSKQSR